MRKVPVLTVVSLASLLVMTVMPVSAATLFGNDTPDIRLLPGTQGSSVFDLDDFFDSATQATISYTATGGSVDANGVASVLGSANPGTLTASFTASAGGETVTVNSKVQVSSFSIGNGAAIDDNNRLVGVSGGNVFYNGIVPGKSASSVKNLVGRLANGNAVTPSAVSGGAALVATIGSVSLATTDTGLRQRSSMLLASGAGKATSGGLTATLNADGSYKLSADSTFASPYVVTLGVKAGAGADGAQLLAAPATDIAFTATALSQLPVSGNPTVTIDTTGVAIAAKAGDAVMVYAAKTTAVGEYATISLDYTTDSTAINLAAIAFDGTLAFQNVSYSNPGAANLDKGVVKNLAITVRVTSGNVIPAFQVAASGAANVKISRLSVIKAGPLTDFALNPNATVVSDSLATLGTWAGDVLGQKAVGPKTNTANHFASAAGANSMLLGGKLGNSNAFITAALGKGTAVGECFVQRQGDADAGSAFTLIFTDGAANAFASFVPGASIPTDSWQKVICTGTLSAPSTGFLVVQAAGLNAVVDDVAVRVITDKDSYFDATLLGL